MKIHFLLKKFSYLVLLTTVFSCQDHRIPASKTQFRLKKYTTVRIDLPTTSVTYTYNNLGKVASYTYVDASRSTPSITNVLYDSQGRISSSQTTQSALNGIIRDIYELDSSGNVIAQNHYIIPNNNPSFLQYRREYVYEGTNKSPVKYISKDGAGNIIQTILYSYVNGNTTRIDYIDYPATSPTATEEYQFDDKPNPLLGISIFGPQPNLFSKNNFIISSRTLTYNADGLPLSHDSKPGEPFYKQTFEYEAY